MSEIHITGSNRFSVRREHALRWTVQLPRINQNNSTNYLMEVHSTSVENLFPIVTEGYNDKLWYSYNGGTTTFVQVSEGNYTIYDLIDSLIAGLQLVDPAFDILFDSLQLKAQLVVPANSTITLYRDITDAFGNDDFSYDGPIDRFLELLGWTFNSASYTITAGAVDFTWIPNNVVRCIGPAFVDLCVSLPLTGVFSETKGRFNVVSRIHFSNTTYGDRNVNINAVPEKYEVNLAGHGEFDFFLVDDHGMMMKPAKTLENIIVTYRISFIPNTGQP